MKRKISYVELNDIIKLMPKKKIKRNNRSEGDCSLEYEELIDPYDLLDEVSSYMKGNHELINERRIIDLILKRTKSF